MGSSMTEVLAYEIPPYLQFRVERFMGTATVPPSVHPITGVESKDVVIAPGVGARLYIPKITDPCKKLPLVVFFHGGGFCIESAASPVYHNFLNSLVNEANVIVVSVDYRRAPEHPVPIAHNDSWTALQWVASHSDQDGPVISAKWLETHADFQRVFFAGDSAGANIAHNMAMRAGVEGLIHGHMTHIKPEGLVLIHPYFLGKEPVGDEAEKPDPELWARIKGWWPAVSPFTSGFDDPIINPAKDKKLSSLGCSRVLVCVAEKDYLRDRGRYYCKTLVESGWGGEVDILQSKGEDHVFFLSKPNGEEAVTMLKRVVSFINEAK